MVQLSPPQNNGTNLKFLGFALCVVVEFEPSKDFSSLNFISLECEYDTNSGRMGGSRGLLDVKVHSGPPENKKLFMDGDHVALGYWDHSNLIQDWNHNSTFKFQFLIDYVRNCRVKCCGVCPVYANPGRTHPMNIPFLERFSTSVGGFYESDDDQETNPSSGMVRNNVIPIRRMVWLIFCNFLFFVGRSIRSRIGWCWVIFMVGFSLGVYFS